MNETQASQLPVYAGNDLGAVWRSSATAFRLWAPTACNAALHRFALSLLSAVPIPDPETARKSHRIVLEGDVPSPLKMPTGCPFRTRCKYATEKCGQEMPQLTDRGNGHMVACWNK